MMREHKRVTLTCVFNLLKNINLLFYFILLNQESAFDAYKFSSRNSHSKSSSLSLLRWRIGPKLHSSDPCCQKIFDRNFRSVQEYFYSIEFETQDENFESRQYRAKFSFRRPFQCFSSGHLRSIRATAWSYTYSDGQNYALAINYPWPHFPENAVAVFVELWVNKTINYVRQPRPHLF